MSDTSIETSTRGPAEHAVRDQIIVAAHECFARYGYAKTTVADLAREIGFSKAYIYRFFESKQAIGEAICSSCLAKIVTEARASIDVSGSSAEHFRSLFRTITTLSVELFFQDRKLYDIAAHSAAEGWGSAMSYRQTLREMLEEIVRRGRESGEFERKTPLDETCRAIFYAMSPFVDPLQLERNLDLLPDGQAELTSLILRSLSP
ncbi:TetR/AcrR family transcriptional regulator [Novosphingobium colocasiae]|uniref:TetR/AcrR family transcriptional regulator n=1 Tax=Novosphingobium colocasiae TaxID=1256513 RepID=UPI0035B47064